jgi:hypothetical protein
MIAIICSISSTVAPNLFDPSPPSARACRSGGIDGRKKSCPRNGNNMQEANTNPTTGK